MSPEFEKYFAQFPVEIRERLDITYQLLKKTCKGYEERMVTGLRLWVYGNGFMVMGLW